MASASGPVSKRLRTTPIPVVDVVEDDGLGGLYDFLPPPDPDKDAAAKAEAERRSAAKPPLPPENRSKVIFLDIDGVLLPAGSVETIFIDGVALPIRATKESDFRLTALSNLRTIVEKTGACIVLSSEWRRTESLRDSIGAVLKAQDIPQVIDMTGILQPRAELKDTDSAIMWCERRAREITKWLKEHKEVEAWVAIDDLDFSWADCHRGKLTPLVKHRSVQTDASQCLTEEDAAEAIRILQNPPYVLDEAVAVAEAFQRTQEAILRVGAGKPLLRHG